MFAGKQPRYAAILRSTATALSPEYWASQNATQGSSPATGLATPTLRPAVDGWINDHCSLDPEAWTRRADLLASFIGWERFDADDLTSAWAARGITYRRKANVHGFDGVKLREADDVQ